VSAQKTLGNRRDVYWVSYGRGTKYTPSGVRRNRHPHSECTASECTASECTASECTASEYTTSECTVDGGSLGRH
jgi:hypothetical protein